MRRLLILGASGSIGTTCIRELERTSYDIKVVGITVNKNINRAKELGKEFNCPYLIHSTSTVDDLKLFIKNSNADIALNGIAGSDGLLSSLLVLDEHIDLALANKESIVMGGSFIFDYAMARGAKIIPVDSEHSALYALLHTGKAVDKLVITASGGPFLDRKELTNVTVDEALNHPTWRMGRKITIDSATLANKGLEVIEASYLFNFASKDIEVVIHRQSIVHSLIRSREGAVYAQLSPPDMTLPIMSAISDNSLDLLNVVSPLSFKDLTLTFTQPDFNKFPLLRLAYVVLERGGSYPIAYNAANEAAVYAFLNHKISFTDIAKITESVINNIDFSKSSMCYDEVMASNLKAQKEAERIIECKAL